MINNIKAELIVNEKTIDTHGAIIQMIVWRVPVPVPPTKHGFKYRLVYVYNGQRIVGFDNERGKGDHMHLNGNEFRYEFISLTQLIEDFISEVDKWRER